MKITGILFAVCLSISGFGQDYQSEFHKLLDEGDTLGQIQTLKMWEQENPTNPELYTSFFNYYFNKSKQEVVTLTEEEPEGESIAFKDSLDQIAGYLGSQFFYDQELFQKGLDKISEGIELYPDRLDMRFGKIYAYGQVENWESFTKEIVKVVRFSSLNKNHWTWTNNEQQENGKEFFLQALQDYQVQLYNTGNDSLLLNMRKIAMSILQYYPDHIESLSNVSVTYLLLDEFDQGIEYLLMAEKIAPEDIVILAKIAHGYKMKGDNGKAIEYYEKIIPFGDEESRSFAKQQIDALKSQQGQLPPQDHSHWHHLDPETDNVLGVSSKRAYEFLKGRDADTVIVAILDNGAELTHEDLQGTFWINRNEIPDNGIDDDSNGYVDDINGWNFLGNSKGENLKLETTGLTRLFAIYREKFSGIKEKDISESEIKEFAKYQNIKHEFDEEVKAKEDEIDYNENVLEYYLKSEEVMRGYFGKDNFSKEDVRSIMDAPSEVLEAKDFFLQIYEYNITKEGLEKTIKDLNRDLQTRLNPDFKNREKIIGDNPDDLSHTNYGNNMVHARGPYHGTGVASIVGALNNGIGIDGIARHVQLMIIRIVPNGDERDKDIALAIKYAAQNGADIINCSFAKKYSVHPEFIQEAITAARNADVLIVQSAGNLGTDNDDIPYYPTGKNGDELKADNWIIVGASRSLDNENLVAYFSNYGKESVDVFAPGYDIKNCVLNNGYGAASGTSAAAPVVAGIAAVLKSYYPHLTAQQLKQIIMKSAYIPKTKKVIQPGDNREVLTELKELSVSGGIANLYMAIELIEKEY